MKVSIYKWIFFILILYLFIFQFNFLIGKNRSCYDNIKQSFKKYGRFLLRNLFNNIVTHLILIAKNHAYVRIPENNFMDHS